MKRPWLSPLIPAYAAAVAAKNLACDLKWLPARRLQRPVISVGSLSAGGAGKTPVVITLAELLTREGIAVDILSRGYGRGSGVAEQVDPAGSAARFGDEPIEMARAGLNVFVGAKRYDAGLLAESLEPSQLHILDDGFQHRELHRDLDLVLLTADDVRDALLPGGNLREPLRSLCRSSVVVLREDEAGGLTPIVARHTSAPIWITRREITLPTPRATRPIAFCGIARPENFFAMLRASGCELAGEIAFPDHHPYRPEDFQRLIEAAHHAGADGFVTTAKDAVKIPPAAMTRLNSAAPIHIAQLTVRFLNEPGVLSHIRQTLHL